MHLELTDGASYPHTEHRSRFATVQPSAHFAGRAAVVPRAGLWGRAGSAGGEFAGRSAKERFRRITEAVVRAGLVGGDTGAVRALRTNVDAGELDDVLVWMIEAAVACLPDSGEPLTSALFTRCGHCGGVLEGFDRSDSGLGLAGQAVEAALADDHALVRGSAGGLLDVTDTDSRNEGLVWLLRVVVWCFGEVLHTMDNVSTGPQHGDVW
ncbi:hypothetical protein [Saccharothrix sp. Mg75]|uniref:hypothetical protein n=1 Tax=Saccharothrix sp. Mg75 TaxID=3445357 RepID=UPI003EEF9465